MLLLRDHLHAISSTISHLYSHHELFRFVVHLIALVLVLISTFITDPDPDQFTLVHWFCQHVRLCLILAAVYFVPLTCFNLGAICFVICQTVRRKGRRWAKRAHLSASYESSLVYYREYERRRARTRSSSSDASASEDVDDWTAARTRLVETWRSTLDSEELLYNAWATLWWEEFSLGGHRRIASFFEAEAAVCRLLRAELDSRASFRALQGYLDWVDCLVTAPRSSVLYPSFFRPSNSQALAHLSLFLPFFIPYPLLSLKFQIPFATFLPPLARVPSPWDKNSKDASAPLIEAILKFTVEDFRRHGHSRSASTAVRYELRLAAMPDEAVKTEERLFWAIIDAVLAGEAPRRREDDGWMV
ncbi:hypothetical protein JCM8097_006477 [Rhodosporidiobolus ruineniae]